MIEKDKKKLAKIFRVLTFTFIVPIYESNEWFIRYDDSPDEDWLVLIYLEDSDAKKGKIVVENKTNPEKHETKSFETKEIFNYSDYLVDSMTAHIDRERQKKAS